jgi:chromosome segregation ATPase
MADPTSEVDRVRADIQRKEDEIKHIKADMKEKEDAISAKEIVLLSKALKAQRDYAGSRIVDLTAQIKDLNGHINSLRSELVELRNQQTKRMDAAATASGRRSSRFGFQLLIRSTFASTAINVVRN